MMSNEELERRMAFIVEKQASLPPTFSNCVKFKGNRANCGSSSQRDT